MGKFEQFKDSRGKKVRRKDAQTAKARWDEAVDDGIIILQSGHKNSAASVRRLAALVATFLIFKGFVIAFQGPYAYGQAILKLSQGNLFEQAGAFLMFPDFASSTVASLLVQLVH